MVTKGAVDLPSREYFQRLDALFLHTDVRHVTTLEQRLSNCHYRPGEELMEFFSRLDGVQAHFAAAERAKSVEEIKRRAMALIGETWLALADLVRSPGGVTYL